MRPDPYRSDPSILTIGDVVTILQISKKAAYSLIHSGELKSFRRGRQFCIRASDLHIYQESLKKKDKFDIELPQSIINSFARHLAAEIRACYDSEEGQAAFEEWLKQHNGIKDD